MRVHVFVEGGGDQDRTMTACKRAFVRFIEKALGGDIPKPRISACGSREDAFRDFCRKVEQDRDVFAVLLVDSEDPVAEGSETWVHLQRRDRWTRPDNAGREQFHLMVECMEAWFLADRHTLAAFYGSGFKPHALPQNPNPELIPKRDVIDGLTHATRGTSKGQYHKTRHGFAILESIDPTTVRRQCPRAEAFLQLLSSRLSVS